jgi:hypothetical protein
MSGLDPHTGEMPFEAGSTPGATLFECGLCGLRFHHGGRVCTSCALGSSCELVRCPRCGFQFPRESRLLRLFGRLLARTRGGRR